MTFSKINQKNIIDNLGFEQLNEVQKTTIKAAEKNQHLMLVAPTGSGKTAAYLLSVISKIQDKSGVQVLILAPTRELVIQIENVLKQMKLPFKVNSCYGGHKFSIERQNFTSPPTILVGTPGRIQDHIQRETVDTTNITQLVFDEFDKSLEFGFSNQMEYIFKRLPNVKRQLLVSATQSITIPNYLNIHSPYKISFEENTTTKLDLRKVVVKKDEKPEGLLAIVNTFEKGQNAIVFVNHRDACNRISEYFDIKKIPYSTFHGGLEQEQRELELLKFRNGTSQVLIATDIASRGIDIPDLDYVIHYQLPLQESVFTHRNGRTARMKANGTSILILTQTDHLPSFLNEKPKPFEFKEKQKTKTTDWATLSIGKGKKDKVNKIDLVGFFLQFNFMEKDDLGLIEVKDHSAFVAVKREKVKTLLDATKNKTIKNKNPKIKLVS